MDELRQEFKKLIVKITDEEFKDEEFDILTGKMGGERYLEFLKNINTFIDNSSRLGREILQDLPQNANLKNLVEKGREIGSRTFEEEPEMIKLIQNSFKNIIDIYLSVEFQKELFTFSTEDSFKQQLKNKFIEDLKISKNAIVKSFKLVINSVRRKQII